MRRVAFAGCREFLGVLADDALALPFLSARGIEVTAWSWDDPEAPWAEQDAVVLRSTWDYCERIDPFEGWIRRLHDDGVRLLNPPQLLLWNTRKTYLRDLEARGVAIVPTLFLEPSELATLPDRVEALDSEQLIVKPAVSAGARGLVRVRREDVQSRRAGLLARGEDGPLLVQPYLPAVEAEGEWSVLYFGGELSHAVLKTVRPGEFRVQEHFGGAVQARRPPADVLQAADAALAAAPGPLLYARVDLLRSGSQVLLGELELLEPCLYLAYDPQAPARFAAAIDRAVPRSTGRRARALEVDAPMSGVR